MKPIPKRNLHVSHGALVLRKHRFWVFPKNPSPPYSPQTPFLLLRGRADTLIGQQQRSWLACAPRSVPGCSYVLSDYQPSAAAHGGYAAVDGRETLQDSTPTPSDHRICFRPETKAAPSRLAGRSKDGSGAVAALLPSFKSINNVKNCPLHYRSDVIINYEYRARQLVDIHINSN